MGIFDFFRKNNPVDTQVEKIDAPIKSKATKIVVRQKPEFRIHNDLAGLIWFADGPNKNYVNENVAKDSFNLGGLTFTVRMTGDEEPSLIYTSQKITIPNDIYSIERPPYFPTYSGLTPEQKGVYISFLNNPYDEHIDIGFVFILYYGLERHLLIGDYERAYKVILKLRDVHSNKSFQSYSANALVLTSMLRQKGEIALEFVRSLDKSYEYLFSDNLFLLCYFSFEIPLGANDIMRMARTFEFTNMNYIKKYPDVFQAAVSNLIIEKHGNNTVLLSNILSSAEVSTLTTQDTPVFANSSIRDKKFPVPLMVSNLKLKDMFNSILRSAHISVKQEIAEMRRMGKLEEVKAEKKTKNLPVFNLKEEQELLDALGESGDDLVQRHFIYISIQDFYYKYRDLDDRYLSLCIDYCQRDIESLHEMEEQYIQKEINIARRRAVTLGNEFTHQQEVEIRTTGFIGRIPAFGRLVIIFEKQKKYEQAVEICDIAISFKHEAEEYKKRKEKLQKKMGSL